MDFLDRKWTQVWADFTYRKLIIKDGATDPNTATKRDLEPLYHHPVYG